MEPANALNFFAVLGKLKTLKRTGWVDNEIVLPESVADHMYRMSMMSFALTDSQLDRSELMKICLVHDLAEAYAGDITPHAGVSKVEKRKLEEDGLNKILEDFSNNISGDEIRRLWLEYEEGTSQEAIIARELDKFEMIVQADEYEKSNNKILESFFAGTAHSFRHPEILAWANELRSLRQARLSSAI